MTQLTLDMVCVKEARTWTSPIDSIPKLNHVLVDLRVGNILELCWTCLPPEKWHGLIGDIQATSGRQAPCPVWH